MDETNHQCKSRKRSRETDRCATTRTRVRGVLSVSYHSCSGKDPQLSKRKRPPTARITVANPPFTQWIALILFQEKKAEMREKDVLIAMNAAFEDMYKKVFADSYQHGAPLRRGARGDFDRMNREKFLDILIEEENPG